MLNPQDLTNREDELLLPSAAGREVGVCSASIRNWIASGRLPAIRLSGGVRAVRRGDLLRVAEERRQQAEQSASER